MRIDLVAGWLLLGAAGQSGQERRVEGLRILELGGVAQIGKFHQAGAGLRSDSFRKRTGHRPNRQAVSGSGNPSRSLIACQSGS